MVLVFLPSPDLLGRFLANLEDLRRKECKGLGLADEGASLHGPTLPGPYQALIDQEIEPPLMTVDPLLLDPHDDEEHE